MLQRMLTYYDTNTIGNIIENRITIGKYNEKKNVRTISKQDAEHRSIKIVPSNHLVLLRK
jgi:hypothetical protein